MEGSLLGVFASPSPGAPAADAESCGGLFSCVGLFSRGLLPHRLPELQPPKERVVGVDNPDDVGSYGSGEGTRYVEGCRDAVSVIAPWVNGFRVLGFGV